ncbi:CamS family sex pheromone protein [Salipaludibacillus neizhouensis]|nr:CamS family sex pheromone protein [Salipaludibacillus neizhouensis]
MRKKISIIGLGFVILLSGCMPSVERSEEDVIVIEETEEEEEQEYIITPTIDTAENYYRNVLKDGVYHRSEARGNVAHAMNNTVDINQFELGLIEIATGFFEQENYYFQEGQFLNGELINSWLRRYDEEDNPLGLNPALAEGDSKEEEMRGNPLVLSHVMEHNYYSGNEEDGVNLGGVVIGLSLRDVYYFRTEDEDERYYFHEEDLDAEETIQAGKEIAQEILVRIREMEGLAEVPITFALYQEEKRGSVEPGTFISMTEVGKGEADIQDWNAVSEDFIVFPSSEASETQPELSSAFSQFREDVEEFFDRSVGVVGRGRYKDERLEELTIELNLQSHGKAEIVALTQFISGRLESTFATQSPIYVYLKSINGTESIIILYPDQEPYVHIYK